ncbi:MAG: DoxX family protein [Ignavibacteria bacterium]|nr:DoxX family protein [Ignavibacteria bacterium]
MLNKLIKTDSKDYIALISRLVLGLVMLPHGAQKLLGMFGGFGLSDTINFFTGTVGIPYAIALLVIFGESIGALLLMFGFAGRVVSLNLIAIMIGAVLTTHIQNGFFMNWFGNQQGEGFEFHILYITLASIIVIKGSGMFSVDALLQNGSIYKTKMKAA